ncbi:hypothetical protein Q8F55_009201 [Vanrija albida]|uniref:Uncharacterized protein n=1 Tax=Vanrija albida TaxID=181172 RepID=A0ABR3PTW2_9TREE
MSPPEVDGGPSSAPPAPGSADAEPKCAEDTGVSGRHGHELVVDEVGDWVHVHVVAREDGPQPAPHGSEERAEHDEARGVARCRGARYPFPVFSVVPLVSGLVLLVQLSLLLLGHFDGLPKSDTPGGWRRFFPRPEWINGAAMAVHAILFFSIAIIRARTPTYHHFHAPSPSGTRRPGEFRLGYIPELSRDAKNYDHDLWGLELAALEQRGRRLSAAVFQRIAYLDLLESFRPVAVPPDTPATVMPRAPAPRTRPAAPAPNAVDAPRRDVRLTFPPLYHSYVKAVGLGLPFILVLRYWRVDTLPNLFIQLLLVASVICALIDGSRRMFDRFPGLTISVICLLALSPLVVQWSLSIFVISDQLDGLPIPYSTPSWAEVPEHWRPVLYGNTGKVNIASVIIPGIFLFIMLALEPIRVPPSQGRRAD